MKRIAVCVLSLFLVAALAGCGEEKGIVEGTVKLDGELVDDGMVTFVKTDGGLVREGAVIKNGSFTARMVPGKYKIEVNGQKVIGKENRPGFDGKEEEVILTDERFPEWYNTKTELSEEIKAGPNTVKLNLKSSK